jgi:hypothetical protein
MIAAMSVMDFAVAVILGVAVALLAVGYALSERDGGDE